MTNRRATPTGSQHRPGVAIQVREVHKLYRRYGRRKNFGTLKSALLSGHALGGLRPDATFEALKGVTFDVAEAITICKRQCQSRCARFAHMSRDVLIELREPWLHCGRLCVSLAWNSRLNKDS